MILLTILKWIGILILALLGLVLFLVVLVLLWPITYQAEGSYNGKVLLRAKVSWFLGLLKIKVSYEEQLLWSVKVCGIQILPKKTASNKNLTDKAAPPQSSDESVKNMDSVVHPEPLAKKQADNEQTLEDSSLQSQTVTEEPKAAGDITLEDTENPKEAEEFSEDLESKVHRIFEKVLAFYEKWKSKILEIFDKIKGIKSNIDYYRRLLQREEVKRTLYNVLRMLGKILKHIRPRKLEVVAHVGMDDPSVTGQIMAIQGILYPWLADHVTIYPYFEEKKLEGRFYIAGHTILGVLLVLAIRIVLNKDFLTLLRILRKKEVAKNGRA